MSSLAWDKPAKPANIFGYFPDVTGNGVEFQSLKLEGDGDHIYQVEIQGASVVAQLLVAPVRHAIETLKLRKLNFKLMPPFGLCIKY